MHENILGKMPQVFRVVRCYNCGTFQVEQVKKSNKWKCKLCGEEQSLKKVVLSTSSACIVWFVVVC